VADVEAELGQRGVRLAPQQADMFGQMRRLFAPLLVAALVAAAVLLVAAGVLIGALAL
jgi:hypothetical protein